jgi:autotransporter-associated beta strand protein
MHHIRRTLFLAAVAASCPATPAAAQLAAFPGAVGFGGAATGGRGSAAVSVRHVTNLNDSGPGSLRDAVSAGNRIVVFDVGGYVTLNSQLTLGGDNITLLGQTAPGDGFGIRGRDPSQTAAVAEVSFGGNANVVARYLRFRPGGNTPFDTNAINLFGASNVVLDHVSIQYARFNNIDAVGATNVTVQNSVIADPISQQFGAHSENTGGRFSWVGNLWANGHNRQPLAKADTQYVNNVVYNYEAGYTVGDTSGSFSHDIVNNYFMAGPTTGSSAANDFFQMNSRQSVYAAGNLRDANVDGAHNGSATFPESVTVLSAPFDPSTPRLPTLTARAAYDRVLADAGASFARDEVDASVVAQAATLGTGGPASLNNSPAGTGRSNGGYGTLAGGTAPPDADADGLPDAWELARGTPTNSANANTDPLRRTPVGYTFVEQYANELIAPAAKTWSAPGGSWTASAGNWAGGAPIVYDRAFVRGTGGANGLVTVNAAGAAAMTLSVGVNGPAAGERLTVAAGGSLTVYDTITVGDQNNATLEVTGGTVSAGNVVLGNTVYPTPGSPVTYTGTLLLTGGVLETTQIVRGGGTTPGTWTTGSAWTWSGGTVRAGGTLNVSAPTTIRTGGATVDTAGYDGVASAALSGAGGLAKVGSGTFTLSAANSYAGGTTIGTATAHGGTLKLAADAAAGTGPIAVAAGGGTVGLADGVTVATNINTAYGFEVLDVPDAGAVATYAGALRQTNNNAIRFQASGVGATLNLTGSIDAGSRNVFLKTGTVVVSGGGSIAGTAGAVGRATGATALTLQDNATFDIGGFSIGGGQPLTAGTINVRGAATLSTGGAALDLLSTSSAAAAATLNLDGGTTTVGTFAKSSAGATQTAVVNFNGGTLRYGGTTAAPAFLPALPGLTAAVRAGGARVDDAGQAVTIAQPLVHDAALGTTRDGGLEKLGAGTLTLAGANAYTGQTTVIAGTLKVGVADAIPHGAGKGNVSLAAGGTLDLNGRDVTVNGLPAAAGAVVDNTAAGAVTLSVGDADTSTTGTPSFNGVIRNTGGPLALTKVGTGSFRLQTAASTYGGDTTVAAGTLDLNAANLLPSGAGRGDVRVNAGATLGLRFGQSVNALTDGAAGGGTVQALSSGTKTLTVGNGDRDGTFSGTIANGSGAAGLAKVGLGTQVLAGDSSYTGLTAVSAGALLVNGSHTGGGAYAVAAGGTLGGTGSITGTLTVSNGGRLSPGNDPGGPSAPGVLSVVGGATLAAGADLVVELNGRTPGSAAAGHDQLAVAGTVVLSGTAAGANGADLMATLGYVPTLGDRLFVVRNDGTDPISGTFQGLPQGGLLDLLSSADGRSYRFAVSYAGNAEADLATGGNDVLLTSVGVPEPSVAGLLLAAATAGLLGRRRRWTSVWIVARPA